MNFYVLFEFRASKGSSVSSAFSRELGGSQGAAQAAELLVLNAPAQAGLERVAVDIFVSMLVVGRAQDGFAKQRHFESFPCLIAK